MQTLQPLQTFAANVHSQFGEDGIIAEILDRIEAHTLLSRWCCEFGAADGVWFSNTCNLIRTRDFRAVMIEADPKQASKLTKNHPGPEVIKLIRKVGFEGADRLDAILEEIYMSLLWQARVMQKLARPLGSRLEVLARAQEVRPGRAEAWCEAARQARESGLMQVAHGFARRAAECDEPADGLFLETDCYRWRSLYEYSLAAFYAGDFGGGARACHRLLYEDLLPEPERLAVVDALSFYPQDAFTYA